ncbi:MAG: hypothetical protein D6702_07420 [Planctomycetota bacterium]|nr:MAG: hypothetical protein D6702_07420 [Planctomycetota bacterium]
MKLVIAEKPSVAADLARALPGTFRQKEGYWEGEDLILSWAVGHLLELAEPEDYDPALKTWQLSTLPILPERFVRKVRPGQKKQLQLLKRLALRPDVDELINACDAAREGELIFREIEEYIGAGKPCSRLWLQSMTREAIREAFAGLQPASRFDGLGAAAFCRAEADWLVGMNATRGITKRLKGRRERGVWSAGRVQTPTLALLVHRELKVLAHVPVPFWRLRGRFAAGGHEYEGLYRTSRSGKDGDKIFDREQAERFLAACRGEGGLSPVPAVASEKVTESVRKPPPLYSLTALQKEANSRYGLSARRTLGAAQRLYESHKVLTYPRTDSTALPADYEGHVQQVLAVLAEGGAARALDEQERAGGIAEAAARVREEGLRNRRRNFDDSRVGDHFALIPTGNLPDTPLGGDDAKVFELVVRRFVAAFLGPSTWENVSRETVLETAAGPLSFFTESRRLVVPGWQAVDRRPPASEVLPPLGVPAGQGAAASVVEVELAEDATRPPARFTEASLLKAMEEASDLDLELHEEIEDEEAVQAMKQKGLGTPATRADIIESLIAKGYASRSGKTLRATAKGIILIDFLERIDAEYLAGAEQTAEMEFHLFQVEAGQRTRESYLAEVADRVRRLIDRLRAFDYAELYRDEPPVGECPVDRSPVREGLKAYRCSRVPRSSRFQIAIRSIPGPDAAKLLPERLQELAAALEATPGVAAVTVAGKRTTAVVTVDLAEAEEVPAAAARLETAAERPWMAACTAGAEADDGCGFALWKEFRGRFINRPVAEKLLAERDSGPLEGFVSMRGDSYAGRIRLDEENKLVFEAVQGLRGGDGQDRVAPELISYPVDESPFVPCPRCSDGRIVETPTHFVCRRDGAAEGCGLSMPRTVCKREMRREDLRSYFDPEVGHTDWIEDFISRKGRPFTARLVRQENGRHRFEFKPRAGRGKRSGGRRAGRKKSLPKKAAGSRKKARAAAGKGKGDDAGDSSGPGPGGEST